MKKKPASLSAFFNPRILISFAFCSIGVLLALIAFALYPGATALAQGPRLNQSNVPGLTIMPHPNGTTFVGSATTPDGTVTPLNEGFESGTLNTFSSTSVPAGTPGWSVVNTAVHTGTFSAFVPDIIGISEQLLTLIGEIPIPAAASSATLTFWHRFDFEGSGPNYYDGGVLENSTDGGATWLDAGPNITAGGYNGTISSNFGNPLAGRMAWGQNPNGTNFVQVRANLLPYAGQNVRFRFREGTDSSNPAPGWWVDDVRVDIAGPCGIPTVNGAITLSDPTQTERLTRGGTASACGAPNTCSTVGGTYHYRAHTFVNTSGASACVTATLTTACTGTNSVFAGAYLNSFNPANICANNVGDLGLSTSGAPLSFAYTVPAGATFIVVVSEVMASGCSAYALDITGIPCSTPTPTPTPTPGGSPAQALNISTRLRVETGDNVLIGGFIVTGSAPKNVAVRGIGPSLGAFGIPGALADPTLELRASNGTLIMQNDNWQDDPAQAAQLTALGLALQDTRESGIVAPLPPNASYTAILAGKNGGTGVGLVEIYDANNAVDSQLVNISTRGFVSTAENVMIGGFILGGSSSSTQVAVRGIGPSLAQFGLSPVLIDPTLELHDSNGATLVSNDNWQDDPTQAAQLTANGLALPDVKESGIFQSLPPGAFTAILAGKNGGTGIGLVEVYNVH